MMRAAILAAAFLCSAPLFAQSPGEIAFWETVRDSRNAAELRAYIERFPNGLFVSIAQSRIAALERAPAQAPAPVARPAPPQPAAPAIAAAAPRPLGGPRTPQTGDAWTYRLTPVRRFGSPTNVEAPRTHTVTLATMAGDRIVDQLAVDGGTPSDVVLPTRLALVVEGASIFSPYLTALGNGTTPRRLGSVEIADPACIKGNYLCEVSARVLGTEDVTVAAGKFTAIKVLVQQSWRAAGQSGSQFQTAQMSGGRTLTIWYAPEVGRAVKYQSRLTVGDIPPIDAHFDLEMQSYQLK